MMSEDFLTALRLGIEHLATAGERYVSVSVIQPLLPEVREGTMVPLRTPYFLLFCAADGRTLSLASLREEDETCFAGMTAAAYLDLVDFTILTQFVVDMDHVGSDDVQWLMLSDLTENGAVVV